MHADQAVELADSLALLTSRRTPQDVVGWLRRPISSPASASPLDLIGRGQVAMFSSLARQFVEATAR